MPAQTFRAVTVDIKSLERRLDGLRRDQVPYALQLTVNNLMKDTIPAEQAEMSRSFDRPTPFVLRGLRVAKWASKKDPSGAIWFKDVFGRYGEAVENTLRPQIQGGDRNTKSTEKRLREARVLRDNEWLVPGGSARLNRYGNVSGAEHVRVLAYFRAFRAAGYNSNRVSGSSSLRSGDRYFVNRAGTGRGIYRVRGRGRPRLVFYLVTRAPRYRGRFDFYGTAARHAALAGPAIADEAKRKALATAR